MRGKLTILFMLLLGYGVLQAQDFVYKPINPAFGGDAFNHNWLMNSASAQNKFKDVGLSAAGIGRNDPAKEFSENLNRLILNQLSRKIIEQQFGEDGLQDGKYTLGDYEITINSGGAGLNVGITDMTTGNRTEVEVPHF